VAAGERLPRFDELLQTGSSLWRFYLRRRRWNNLIVTDERNSHERGMIHFAVLNGRVRFHIDRSKVKEAGLQLGARLLNIALTVQDATGRGGTP
jgi:hypothetical protein